MILRKNTEFLACTFYINPSPVPDFIWTFKYMLSVMVTDPLGPFELSGRQEYQLKLGCVTEMLTMSVLSWLSQLESFTLSMMLAAAFQKIKFELETLRLCTTAFSSRVLTTWLPYLPPPYQQTHKPWCSPQNFLSSHQVSSHQSIFFVSFPTYLRRLHGDFILDSY